ncbi:MAG TPA: hypothetical protein VHA33_22410 [Candidatus Angelobacter sp.]|jgi:hypothetical protein|nr:hypothetical protein [Candidatus Angelobacter sp.]
MTGHFDVAEWTDYVRNLVPPPQNREMEVHLQQGCIQCNTAQEWLSKFARTCARMSAYNVPDHFGGFVPSPVFPRRTLPVPALKRVWATLQYDSLTDPQPSGARAGQQASRHLLFQAGAYAIDVRFEREKGSAHLMLAGQIAKREDKRQALVDSPVMLFSGSQEVARCTSNEFGEFQFDYVPQPDLHLRVPLPDAGEEIQVTLSDRKTFEGTLT